METLAVIYMLATGAQILATAPQAVRLYRQKKANDISLATWVMWTIMQLLAMFYIVAQRQWVMMYMAIGWIIMYIVVISLIMYYRYFYRQPTEVCSNCQAAQPQTVYNGKVYGKKAKIQEESFNRASA